MKKELTKEAQEMIARLTNENIAYETKIATNKQRIDAIIRYGSDILFATKTICIGGVNWAREDFILTHDVTLDGGRILKKGTEFFSWYDAVALERKGMLPVGFRLPTLEEFKKLIESTAGGKRNILGLRSIGHIINPGKFNDVSGRFGGYWSSTGWIFKRYAYFLTVFKDGTVALDRDLKEGCGFYLRLVAE